MAKILYGMTVSLVLAYSCLSAEPLFSVILPLGKAVKSGGVLPVRVELQTSEPFIGEIELSLDGGVDYRLSLPVRVGQGRFKYEIPFPATGDLSQGEGVSVRLRSSVSSKSVAKVIQPEQWATHTAGVRFVLWLGPRLPFPSLTCQAETGADSQSLAASMASSLPDEDESNHENSTQKIELLFQYPQVHLLPEDSRLYQCVDVLVLAKRPRVDMTVKQVAALVEWIKRGGQLVTIGDSVRDNDPLMRALVGLPNIQGGDMSIRHLGFGNHLHVPDMSALVLVDGSEAAQGANEPTSGNGPNLVDSPQIAQAQALFKRLVEERLIQPSTIEQSYVPLLGTNNGHDDLVSALAHMTGLEPISTVGVVFYLLAFVLVVTVVERIVIRKTKRFNLTWILTPLAVIVFCIGARVISRVTRGTRARYSGIHVEDYAADGVCVENSGMCIIPSWHKSWAFNGRDNGILCPIPNKRNQLSGAGATETMDLSFSAPVWGSNFIYEAFVSDKSPPFSTQLIANGTELTGTVQRRAEVADVTPVAVMYMNAWYSVTADGTVSSSADTSRFNLKLLQANNEMFFVHDPDRHVWAFDLPFLYRPPMDTNDPSHAIVFGISDRKPFRELTGNVQNNHLTFVRQVMHVIQLETTE